MNKGQAMEILDRCEATCKALDSPSKFNPNLTMRQCIHIMRGGDYGNPMKPNRSALLEKNLRKIAKECGVTP